MIIKPFWIGTYLYTVLVLQNLNVIERIILTTLNFMIVIGPPLLPTAYLMFTK